MDLDEKLRVLARIAETLNRNRITYAVGASAMLYLRGIADSFNDIDLTVAEAAAPRAIEALRTIGTMAPPDQSSGFLTHCFRTFEIDGVEVDLIAGMVIVSDGTAHDCPLRPEDIDATASVRGVPVPLHSPACWRRFYALMGRQAKAERIDAWLRERETPAVLKDDPFYTVLAAHPRVCLEYCLMKQNAPYAGETSHRAALAFAVRWLSAADEEEGCVWSCEIEKAAGHPIPAETLLALPDRPWKRTERYKGTDVTAFLTHRADGGPIPYWFAFLEPPHGSDDGPEDFAGVNAALFPAGTAGLEAYEWSTDWSDYFDDGHEWWGAACWSVYDRALDRFAVILASATD